MTVPALANVIPHSLNFCKAFCSAVSLDSLCMFAMVALTYPSIQGGICFHCIVQIHKGHRMDTALTDVLETFTISKYKVD